jgi:protein CpxP
MKTKLAVLALLTATVTGAAMTAGAFEGSFRGRGCCGGGKAHHERGLAGLSEKLGLTAEQKAKIEAIRDANREKAKPLRQELRENGRKLQELAKAETFDEAAARALASEQADVRAELTVQRLKARHEVRSVLTPEQRELARTLRHSRKGGPRADRGLGS